MSEIISNLELTSHRKQSKQNKVIAQLFMEQQNDDKSVIDESDQRIIEELQQDGRSHLQRTLLQ
jgi:hypothetical protein